MSTAEIQTTDRPSINQQIYDDAIAHAVEMERMGRAESEKHAAAYAAALLLLVDAVLKGRIERIRSRGIAGRSPFGLEGYADLVRITRDRVRGITSQLRSDLRTGLRAVSRLEVDFQIESIERALEPLEIKLTRPGSRAITQSYAQRPIGGRMLSDDLRKLADDTTKAMLEDINTAFRRVDATPETAARALRDRIKIVKHNAETLTRTAYSGGRSNARELVLHENRTMVRAVVWTAVLDSRTCNRCYPISGTAYEVGKGPRPTLHPRCRCVMVPRIIDTEQLAGRRKIDALPEETRASMDGPVAGDATYGEWLRNTSPANQALALGKKAADLFRRGVIDISDYRDRDHRPLSLRKVLRRKGLNPSDYGLN